MIPNKFQNYENKPNVFFQSLLFFLEKTLLNLVLEKIKQNFFPKNSLKIYCQGPTWNLGGRQIVSGPIFSDSPYKNVFPPNFLGQCEVF
jgi:hypothetical protein